MLCPACSVILYERVALELTSSDTLNQVRWGKAGGEGICLTFFTGSKSISGIISSSSCPRFSATGCWG